MYFVYGISSPTLRQLAALSHFLLLQSPFSFLQCRSEMRKDLLFWQKFKFLYATPASPYSAVLSVYVKFKQTIRHLLRELILVPGF